MSSRVNRIDALRKDIDAAQTVQINQKIDLIKSLNTKKERLIQSIDEALAECRDAESTFYNRSAGDSRYHEKLESINRQLRAEHLEGSRLIGQINAVNNFQQLTQIEQSSVNPFLNSVKSNCATLSRTEVPTASVVRNTTVIQPVRTIIRQQVPVPTPVPAPIQNRTTEIHHHHHTPVVVNTPPPVVVPSPPPVRVAPVVVPTRRVRAVRATPVRAVPVSPVSVRPISPVEPRVVLAPSPARVLPVVTAPSPRVLPVVTTTPVGSMARVTHDYNSAHSGTLNLKRNTRVNIINYNGDWAFVRTMDGHQGYVSRHFLQPL